ALFHAVMADAQHDPRIANLADLSSIKSIAQEAVAPATLTGHVVRTRAMIPTLMSNPSRWHQDVLNVSGDGRSCGSVRVACWIPLGNGDERSGALEVIPGVWTPLPHQNDDGQFSILDQHVPSAPRAVVPVRCGDVVLLDRFIPHRSMPAERPHARWAVVVWF